VSTNEWWIFLLLGTTASTWSTKVVPLAVRRGQRHPPVSTYSHKGALDSNGIVAEDAWLSRPCCENISMLNSHLLLPSSA